MKDGIISNPDFKSVFNSAAGSSIYRMRKTKFIGVLLFAVLFSSAQDLTEHLQKDKPGPHDSSSLKNYVKGAQWEIHSRNFFMSTLNQGMLKDDYALASGIDIGFITASFKGLQFGIKTFYGYRLFSSEIYAPDLQTGQSNRYEIGLFDINDFSSRQEFKRLEELYLKYNYSSSYLIAGKLNLNTPFFNPQDGRMSPTVEEGVWLAINESTKLKFNGGWIWKVSPRSTQTWFTTANSIGIYPMGVNSDGSKANYYNSIVGSSGIAIANVEYRPTKKFNLSVWDAFHENVINTTLLELKFMQAKQNLSVYQGLLLVHQNAINNGGNADQTKSYAAKGEQSNALSFQIGIKKQNNNTSLNYTHITGDGRYLMPREWGREVFYTFLNRERNEGYGNLHAAMIKTTHHFSSKLETSIAYGYYLLPDVKNTRLNKYGMPSYHQLNYSLNYQASRFLKGLQFRLLLAYKLKSGNTYENARFEYNKVNMLNINLILDYKV